MPHANIYTSKPRIKLNSRELETALPGLRRFLAETLSCGPRRLEDEEMSIKILTWELALPIAETEVILSAHAYPERIQRQDELCNITKRYIREKLPYMGKTEVWLELQETGFSFEG